MPIQRFASSRARRRARAFPAAPLIACLLLAAQALLATRGWAQSDAISQETSLPATVAAALRAAHIPSSAVAVQVQAAGAAQPLLAFNAEQPMNPASTMKLVTSFAAMDMLGPAYTWKTEVWADGPLADGALSGNLYLRGHGDPKLTIENLWLLASRLRARGLRDIRGDLVLDRGAFAAAPHDPAAFDADPDRPYNVGPDALLLNFKSVRFTFVPDGARVRVAAEPRMAKLDIAADLRPTQEACGDWRAHLHSEFLPSVSNYSSNSAASGPAGEAAQMRAMFSGAYPVACGEQTLNVALFSQDTYFDNVFRPLWAELGGSLQGALREGAVPAGARLLYTQESPPLADVVRDINKFSNNVMARQLFLTLSMEKTGQAASEAASAQVLRAWLAARGIDMPELVLENGSGLSRSERISARSMSRLLAAIQASPFMPEMLASLPVVALDGTMRHRLQGDAVAGQGHIKTGSLDDVRAMAGYVLAANGKLYSVVCLVNHANAAQSRAAQDALLRWVYGLQSADSR